MGNRMYKRPANATLFGLLVALLLVPSGLNAYSQITSDSLRTWLESADKPFLLDVREQSEFIARRLENSVLFPWNSGRLQTAWERLPSSGPIVVICAAGARSALAAAWLESLPGGPFSGRLTVLTGGMDGWRYAAVLNDNSSFPRANVLLEMFTASWCPYCFDANLHVDRNLLTGCARTAVIRYHVQDSGFVNPSVRANYYRPQTTPYIFIDGSREIYPDYATAAMLNDALTDSSTLSIAVLGRLPTAADSGTVRVRITAKARADMAARNLFVVLTESEIDGTKPPYKPTNGETVFDNAMRAMLAGDNGREITVFPGETREVLVNFALNPAWKSDNCELVVFVQNLQTRKVIQTVKVKLPDLRWEAIPANRPPVLRLPDGNSYNVIQGDTVRVRASVSDPDSGDVVIFWPYYAPDGVTYCTALPPNAAFSDSVFRFAPDSLQVGTYKFMLRVMDHAGATDSVRFTVEVLQRQPPAPVCDFDRDGRVSLKDIIAFLLLLRNGADDPRLDWNGDGVFDLSDAVAFTRDLTEGKCNSGAALSAATGGSGTELTISPADAAWMEEAISGLGLDSQTEAALRVELAGINRPTALPRQAALLQNEPNPFNPATVIYFDIPDGSDGLRVKLEIHDLRGRSVRLLRDSSAQPGRHAVFWDGRDDNGREVPSGVYFCRLTAGERVQTRKMVLLR